MALIKTEKKSHQVVATMNSIIYFSQKERGPHQNEWEFIMWSVSLSLSFVNPICMGVG